MQTNSGLNNNDRWTTPVWTSATPAGSVIERGCSSHPINSLEAAASACAVS